MQLQNRISPPKGKNDDFEALFQRNAKEKISSAKIEKNLLPKHQSQPSCIHYTTIHESQLQKDTSITHAAAAARNLDAAIPLRSAQTELQNTIAQRQQRRGKVTSNPRLHCAPKSAGFDGKAMALHPVTHASQLRSATGSP